MSLLNRKKAADFQRLSYGLYVLSYGLHIPTRSCRTEFRRRCCRLIVRGLRARTFTGDKIGDARRLPIKTQATFAHCGC